MVYRQSRRIVVSLTWLLVCSSVMAQQPTGATQAEPSHYGPQTPQRVARSSQPEKTATVFAQPVAPMAPAWIPLPAKHQQYLDQVLKYWEFKSSQVKRYRCHFKRWTYDPEFGPKTTFKAYSEGQIMYSAPDKGLFRVEKMLKYQPPRERGGKPQYVPEPESQFERWICDGHWIYQFDHHSKKLIQQELPPELRGKAIGKGPLPFLFNSKVADIKRRFWVRVVTPPDVKKEYWLEAVPKTQEDAANFQMVQVVIDEADFLPKAMVLYGRSLSVPRGANGQPSAPLPPPKTSFQFESREVNFSVLAQQLNIFHREFYDPDVPKGWTKVVQRWEQPSAPPIAPAGERAQGAGQPTRR